MTIADSIRETFTGIHSGQLIGEENPGTLDTHPLFFFWERILSIEQEFTQDELEDHFLTNFMTSNPDTSHQSYQELFDEWQAFIEEQKRMYQENPKMRLVNISPLSELVTFLRESNNCKWIIKLDEALGDHTFKALVIWLLSFSREGGPSIFHTLHNTKEEEDSITNFSYEEDEFFVEAYYDATDCTNVIEVTTIDNLPIPSSISRVTKDGQYQALELYKEQHGQLERICSDDNYNRRFLAEDYNHYSLVNYILVPKKTYIPLCIYHFDRALSHLTDLQPRDIHRINRFISAGGHPGVLTINWHGSGFGDQDGEEMRVPENFTFGHGVQQNDQGQDVFIIFLKINQLSESFEKRLPAALEVYKTNHNGLPIGIIGYGSGMWEIFSKMLFVGCEHENVIGNVDCLLHFTDAGQPKTEASPRTRAGRRGWEIINTEYQDARGYWSE